MRSRHSLLSMALVAAYYWVVLATAVAASARVLPRIYGASHSDPKGLALLEERVLSTTGVSPAWKGFSAGVVTAATRLSRVHGVVWDTQSRMRQLVLAIHAVEGSTATQDQAETVSAADIQGQTRSVERELGVVQAASHTDMGTRIGVVEHDPQLRHLAVADRDLQVASASAATASVASDLSIRGVERASAASVEEQGRATQLQGIVSTSVKQVEHAAASQAQTLKRLHREGVHLTSTSSMFGTDLHQRADAAGNLGMGDAKLTVALQQQTQKIHVSLLTQGGLEASDAEMQQGAAARGAQLATGSFGMTSMEGKQSAVDEEVAHSNRALAGLQQEAGARQEAMHAVAAEDTALSSEQKNLDATASATLRVFGSLDSVAHRLNEQEARLGGELQQQSQLVLSQSQHARRLNSGAAQQGVQIRAIGAQILASQSQQGMLANAVPIITTTLGSLTAAARTASTLELTSEQRSHLVASVQDKAEGDIAGLILKIRGCARAERSVDVGLSRRTADLQGEAHGALALAKMNAQRSSGLHVQGSAISTLDRGHTQLSGSYQHLVDLSVGNGHLLDHVIRSQELDAEQGHRLLRETSAVHQLFAHGADLVKRVASDEGSIGSMVQDEIHILRHGRGDGQQLSHSVLATARDIASHEAGLLQSWTGAMGGEKVTAQMAQVVRRQTAELVHIQGLEGDEPTKIGLVEQLGKETHSKLAELLGETHYSGGGLAETHPHEQEARHTLLSQQGHTVAALAAAESELHHAGAFASDGLATVSGQLQKIAGSHNQDHAFRLERGRNQRHSLLWLDEAGRHAADMEHGAGLVLQAALLDILGGAYTLNLQVERRKKASSAYAKDLMALRAPDLRRLHVAPAHSQTTRWRALSVARNEQQVAARLPTGYMRSITSTFANTISKEIGTTMSAVVGARVNAGKLHTNLEHLAATTVTTAQRLSAQKHAFGKMATNLHEARSAAVAQGATRISTTRIVASRLHDESDTEVATQGLSQHRQENTLGSSQEWEDSQRATGTRLAGQAHRLDADIASHAGQVNTNEATIARPGSQAVVYAIVVPCLVLAMGGAAYALRKAH